MPADSKAKYYQWFMTDDHNARIVGFEWFPLDGEIVSSMTLGKLIFRQRDEPGDTWGPPKTISENIPWVVAQTFAKGEGFHVEIAIHE